MTLSQQIITIAMCVLGTMLTRFLPFAVFSSKRPTPPYIQYLGKVLPGAIFSMLVVYCLRHVSLLQGSHGLPELITILLTVGLHIWKKTNVVVYCRPVRFAICFLSSLSFKKNAHMKCLNYFRNNQGRRSTADFRPYFLFLLSFISVYHILHQKQARTTH